MSSNRRGSHTLKRAASALIGVFMVMASIGNVSANVGTVTVNNASQNPSPVVRGSSATFSVTVQNSSGSPTRYFSATALTGGAAGVSLVSSTCVSIAPSAAGTLSVTIGTTASTPAGSSAFTLTVSDYNNANGGCTGTPNSTNTGAGTIVVANVPLTVTMTKYICPTYSVVPANVNPGNLDATGGHSGQLNTGYTAKPVTPANSTPVGCIAGPGWQYQFLNGQNGSVISTYTMGSGGSSTITLRDDELALARGGGLWIQEATQASAAFGAIRCYNDVLNGDNLEQMTGVPDSATQVWCFAYNVSVVPHISLTKTASPTTFSAAGQTINYTIKLTNDGNVALTNPALTDLDAGISALNCGGALPASLAVGASITCTTTRATTASDVTTGSFKNTANGSAQYNSAPVTGTADATITLVHPGFSITKTASPTTFSAAGQTITYTIVLANTGDVALANPSVSDPSVGTLDCLPLPGSLAVGASITCHATRATTASDVTTGSFKNTATGGASLNGSALPSKTADATITLVHPSIGLVKTAGQFSYKAVGDVLHYTVTLTNTGDVTVVLGTPAVTDPLVSDLTCGIVPAFLASGESLECYATYTIVQADIDAGHVTNTAAGHAFYGSTPLSDTDSVTADAGQAPVLTVKKSSDAASYGLGDTITYSYLVTNTGNVTINALSVVDDKLGAATCLASSLAPAASTTCSATHVVTLADLEAGSITNNVTADGRPAGGTLVPATDKLTVTITGQRPRLNLVKTASPTTYTKAGDVINYSFVLTNIGNVTINGPFTVSDPLAPATCPALPASLAPGDSVTCTGSHTATQFNVDAGVFINVAVGQGHFGARNVISNIASATVTATAAPALTLVKTANTATYSSVGDKINYQYALTNSGNVTIYRSFTVTDDKVTVSCPNTPIALAPGASVTCTASHTITQADLNAGSITNHATGHAHRNLIGSTLVNSNSDSVTVSALAAPKLTLKKTADATTYSSGDLVTYSYLVTNTGNVTINSLVLTDDKLGTITCSVTSLAAGAYTTCTATHTTTAADVTAGSITNNASVDGTPTGGSLSAATDSLTITAASPAPSPKLTLKKTAAENHFNQAGDLIHYSYLVTNSGNVDLTGPITVTDDKLATVTCPPTPTLAVGAHVTCTATYTVTPADELADHVVNLATAHALYDDGATPAAIRVIDSDQATLDVSITGTQTVAPATGKPTAPPTNTSGNPGGDSTPLLGFLICLAFASFAVFTVRAQRRGIKR